MAKTMRQRILRANALWLVVAAGGGLLADALGIFFARGPQRIIAVALILGSASSMRMVDIVAMMERKPTRVSCPESL